MNIDYLQSFRSISNHDRNCLKVSRTTRNRGRCSLHYSKHQKALFVATPYAMPAIEVGEAVERLGRLYGKLVETIIPVSLPMGAA